MTGRYEEYIIHCVVTIVEVAIMSQAYNIFVRYLKGKEISRFFDFVFFKLCAFIQLCYFLYKYFVASYMHY